MSSASVNTDDENKNKINTNSAFFIAAMSVASIGFSLGVKNFDGEFSGDVFAGLKFICASTALVATIPSIAYEVGGAFQGKEDGTSAIPLSTKVYEALIYNIPAFVITTVIGSACEYGFYKEFQSKRGLASILISDGSSVMAFLGFLIPSLSKLFFSLDNGGEGIAFSVANSGHGSQSTWQEYYYGVVAGVISGWFGGLLYNMVYTATMEKVVESEKRKLEVKSNGGEGKPLVGKAEEGGSSSTNAADDNGVNGCYWLKSMSAFAVRGVCMEICRTLLEDLYIGELSSGQGVNFLKRLAVNLACSVVGTILYAPAVHCLKKYQYAQVKTPCNKMFFKKMGANLLQNFSGNIAFNLLLPLMEHWLQRQVGIVPSVGKRHHMG
jgi:hypothetical protein